MTDLYGKTLTELNELLTTGDITRAELHSYFLERSKQYNSDLNAYLTFAETDEVEVTPNKVDGNNDAPAYKLLKDIPLAIKDNYCTKGLRTTAASKVLENFIPEYDSTVTSRLKEAGISIIGKTNMDAWAHGSSGETSGYGPTTNPWDMSKVPGGSSSGSAAATAAYLAPAAIGSETAGSIRQPAAWCGIVGLKPTYGRVSRYGVAAMGSSFDCPGPLTLNTEDAATILQAIAGHDPYDATSSTQPVPDYHAQMREGRKYTLGIAKEYMDSMEEPTRTQVEAAIKLLEKQGHKVKEVSLIHPSYSISVYTILQRAEVSSNLARLHGIRYSEGRERFGKEAKTRMMLGAYTLAHGYYDAYYKRALKVRTLIIEDFKKAFQDVDIIVSSPAPITAIEIGEFENYPFFGEQMDILNEPAAVAGIPAINVPIGLDDAGLPIGMQFMANYFKEGELLDIAYQYEAETKFNDVIKKGLDKWK